MSVEDIILRLFKMLGGIVAGPVILGAVNHAGLQGVEHVPVRHRGSAGPQGFHQVNVYLILNHANLHALQIFNVGDRLARIEAAGAGVVISQPYEFRIA
ncbi:hypothetical protein D3C81_1654010 [compost metagenome]